MIHDRQHPANASAEPPTTLTRTPMLTERLLRAFGKTAPGGASWSERAPNGASSALAPAPGVAGESESQGAPEEVAAEGSRDQGGRAQPLRDRSAGDAVDTTSDDDVPSQSQPLPAAHNQFCEEQPSWRGLDDPPLPAPRNRKRTTEKRDRQKKIRFTPTAVRVISAAARQRGLTFAGFVGDAALTVALGKTTMHGSPEDDPVRPLVETVEKLTADLRRVGNNLNQIAKATNASATPEYADHVLDSVEAVLDRAYQFLDRFTAEGP